MSDIEDGVKNAVNIVFAQVEQDIDLLIKNNEGSQLVKRYNLLHDAYLAKETEVSTIRSCVKVGEKQETAIKKLSKMSKTLKYFNLESMKVTTNYFDAMSEKDILDEYRVCKDGYFISICRIEPENNCHITLEAFAQSDRKLIFIGNWNHSEYSRTLKEQYGKEYKNIVLLDSIYDIETLYILRRNARMYIHGHSAGGTNPSLVEAMFTGKPILAYDVVYNRETTFHRAYYFSNAESLRELMEREDLDGAIMKELALENYTWKRIAKQYESLY